MIAVACRKAGILLVLVVAFTALAALLAVPASAYPPPVGNTAEPFVSFTCANCHATDSLSSAADGSGPHKNYTATTVKCQICHRVHTAAAGNGKLLLGTTISNSCLICHDGTGATVGVYTTIEAHDPLGAAAVKADHSVDATTVIPGGSIDLGAKMGCNDCHSPHGVNTVEPFLRDSGFSGTTYIGGAAEPVVSDCLLRSDVNTTTVDGFPEYGAKWCASCHDERHSDSVVVNHVVDGNYDWGYGDIVSTLGPSSFYMYPAGPTAVGMGRTNGAYVMAPVTADDGDGQIEEADRRAPICQQCHEDARDVMAPFQGDYTHRGVIDPMDPGYDPWLAPINPQYLTFPHQTTNANMLVETDDDLCLNCHLVSTLP